MWKYSWALCSWLSPAPSSAAAGRLRPSSARSAKTSIRLSSPASGRRPLLDGGGAGGEVAAEDAVLVVRVHVEAQQEAAKVLLALCHAGAGRDLGRGRRAGRARRPRSGLRGLGGRVGVLLDDLLQAQQRGAGLDLGADGDGEFLQAGLERRAQHRLHLHALQHDDRRAGFDLGADLQRRGDHQRRGGGADDAAFVAGDAVGDAVDFDLVHGAVGGGEQAEAFAVDDDLAGVPVEAVEHDVGGRRLRAVAVAYLYPDAEAGGADAGHADAVADAAQLQVQRAAGLVLHLRAAAGGGGQQPGALDAFLVFVGVDRGGGEGDGGVAVRDQAAFGADAVDPAGVGGGVDDFGLVEQVQRRSSCWWCRLR